MHESLFYVVAFETLFLLVTVWRLQRRHLLQVALLAKQEQQLQTQ